MIPNKEEYVSQFSDISTDELVVLLVKHPFCFFEVGMALNHGGSSTHTLSYNPTNKGLYDEGCTGETRKTTIDEFVNDPHYYQARWRVWQIIEGTQE